MTAAAGTPSTRRHWGRTVPVLVLVVLAGAAIWASAGGSSGGSPLDPASAGPDGTKALDLLVGRLGGRVDTGGQLPAAGHGVALILADHLSASSRRGVDAWVRSGGTLVIADPSSDLAGVAPAEGSSPNAGVSVLGPLTADCSAPWVAGVDQISAGAVALLAAPPGATAACFDGGGGSFAVERTVGAGTVVSLAGPPCGRTRSWERSTTASSPPTCSSPRRATRWRGSPDRPSAAAVSRSSSFSRPASTRC